MDKIYPEEHIQAIANAIRRKNGRTVNYLTSEMAGAIDQLMSYPEPTGTQTITENGIVDVKDKAYADVNVQASATLISKTITANGEYDAEDDEADGYSDVTVNVPNSYSASDEGKVVSSGALVAQTSTTKTANGTYDTTENNEVVVNVPQPSGNINITDMQSTDVSAYATAQIVDADLVAGNIKKDVDILGVTGTYEGSGGGSTLITKTITQNGTYDAEDDNADGYSSVVVAVPQSGLQLPAQFEWDFTESLIDSVNGLEATLSNATQTSSGISIASSSAAVAIPMIAKAIAAFSDLCTIELDVGGMQYSGSGNHRFLMFTSAAGLIFRSTGKWSFYTGSWATDSNITDFDYFANSTVKMTINSSGTVKIYKDNTLIYEPNKTYDIANSSGKMYIGSTSDSCNSCIVKALRIINSNI